jgi:transcriptional regulator with XRE-family HTH domain
VVEADQDQEGEQLLEAVGRRIAELRARAGKTQAAVAEAVGTNVQNLQRVERGEQNLTLKTLLKFARAIGVEVRDLLDPPPEVRERRGPGRPKKALGP